MLSSWTIGRKITAGYALSLIVLILIGTVSYRSVDALIDASTAVHQANHIQGELAQILSSMKDAETGQRGFVITGDETYLAPYLSGREEVGKEVGQLRELFKGDAAKQKQIDEAERLIGEKLAELKLTIETRKASGFEATLKIVVRGTGKTYMDDLRNLLGVMDQEQADLLGRLAVAAEGTSASAKNTIIAGTIVAIALMIVAGVIIIRSTTQQLGSAVHDMESASSELQAASQQQATGAKEQATAMAEIATTMNELLATSRQIADSAQRVAQVAEKTAGSARMGEQTVGRTRESMASIQRQVELIVTHMLDLGRKSQQIGGVIDLINELAEQTNILAINATIEAVGAGEAGKRFSVVADEIRKLADRVGGSTKEIRGLIEDVRAAVNTTVMVTEAGSKAVDAGSRQVVDVAASFTAIAGLVETTTASAQEIGLSTKQQTTAVEQVNGAITNVSQASRESEASTTQTLQTASQLAQLSRGLNRLIRD